MAVSPAHVLGELIGVFFEDTMKTPIAGFSKTKGLYFDTEGFRKARKTKKVTWTDVNGNCHDLDYVIERGGSDDRIGVPVAFIELAWRRYTKHSKNKAQEISGAVNPIAEKFAKDCPFKGAILSGDFTATSLEQLHKEHFHVLYVPFKKIVSAFGEHGLDIYFDESTSEKRLKEIVQKWKTTPPSTLDAIRTTLCENCDGQIREFVKELRMSVDRKLDYILVLPLHGKEMECKGISDAIELIQNLSEVSDEKFPLHHLEIIVAYSNGTKIDGRFVSREEAVDFIKSVAR